MTDTFRELTSGPHVRSVHTPSGPRSLGLAAGEPTGLPVALPVRMLELCRSRSGVWRRGHSYDRDSVCTFCDRERGSLRKVHKYE